MSPKGGKKSQFGNFSILFYRQMKHFGAIAIGSEIPASEHFRIYNIFVNNISKIIVVAIEWLKWKIPRGLYFRQFPNSCSHLKKAQNTMLPCPPPLHPISIILSSNVTYRLSRTQKVGLLPYNFSVLCWNSYLVLQIFINSSAFIYIIYLIAISLLPLFATLLILFNLRYLFVVKLESLQHSVTE